MKERVKKERRAKEKLKGNMIKFYMEKKEMIAEELSELSGIDTSFLSRIINNKRMCISLPIAFRISKALGEPVEKLFLYEFTKRIPKGA